MGYECCQLVDAGEGVRCRGTGLYIGLSLACAHRKAMGGTPLEGAERPSFLLIGDEKCPFVALQRLDARRCLFHVG